MKNLLLFSLLSSLIGCNKPDDQILSDANGVATRLPHLWKSSTSQDGGLSASMAAQHIYNNRYLLTAQREPQSTSIPLPTNLCFKRLEDGKDVWVWKDRFRTNETSATFNYGIYANQDLLLYNYGPRSYCINQQTGQTVWKKEWTPGISNIITTKGLGDHFYFTGTPPALYNQKRFEESIYQGDMATGAIREIAKLAVLPGKIWRDPSGYDEWSLGRRISVFVRRADTLLLVSYDLPDPRPAFTTTSSGYLSLYNLTQQKWVYEQKPMINQQEAGGGNHPNIIGDKVYYAINMWIGCFDLMTGERVWMKRITEASLFSHMIVAEGKLLANGQDAKLYCLDPQTGNTLWTQRSSGIGSSLHYQDGVVYYIASQNLLATEVATGKLLWNLDCPDYYTINRGDSWFSGFVTGLSGTGGKKGRIFASTNLNVYSFEAAK